MGIPIDSKYNPGERTIPRCRREVVETGRYWQCVRPEGHPPPCAGFDAFGDAAVRCCRHCKRAAS